MKPNVEAIQWGESVTQIATIWTQIYTNKKEVQAKI